MNRQWDIFCKVVDNYGDAGVSWRLSKMLAHEHGLAVRLWIDQPQTLAALVPALDTQAVQQRIDGVTVCDWSRSAPSPASLGVVVEAFGCGLPERLVEAIAGLVHPPLWIVLEYLTAEPWADNHHGLASPHPRLPLQRWMFFPGFTQATGGLLQERDLQQRRDSFNAEAGAALWRDLGYAPPPADALALSLFGYGDAQWASLFEALSAHNQPTVVAVPPGALHDAAVRHFASPGPWIQRGLEVRPLPFLAQQRFDELLWACDLNFVRGEDSFVRAQWAARPMIWQPYRQDAGAHRLKLEAFMARYSAGLDVAVAEQWQQLSRAWSEGGAEELAASWQVLRPATAALAAHARHWAKGLAEQGELTAKLVEFAHDKVK